MVCPKTMQSPIIPTLEGGGVGKGGQCAGDTTCSALPVLAVGNSGRRRQGFRGICVAQMQGESRRMY